MGQVIETVTILFTAVKTLVDSLDPQLVANVIDAATNVVALSS